MEQHVRILAWINLILGGLGVAAAVVVGSLFGFVGLFTGDLAAAGGFAFFGALMTVFIAIFCVPQLIAGWGLLKYAEWARILTIILSVLSLPGFPVGTLAGGYGLWVLFNDETIALFRARQAIG